MRISMKAWSKATLVGLMSASIVVSGSVAAGAYPIGEPMTVTVTNLTVVAKAKISVSANKVKPDCIVTLGWDNENKGKDDYLDYDWFDVIASRTGKTPRKPLTAPKVAGDYSVIAITEDGCVGDAEHNPSGEAIATQTVRVGTRVVTTAAINTSLLASKGRVAATGNFGNVGGEKITLTLFNVTTNKAVKKAVVKSAKNTGAFKFTFSGLKKSGAVYRLDVSYAPTAKYFIDSPNGAFSVSKARARVVR
jgi:hypothetical protein